jgi:GntR family transcriptional regulator, transcriptional repressor for pyruvate dehydrogenase complex
MADTLFARLDQEIRAGAYSAGDRLPTEKEIAEREGVSRTVVREAIARLVARGLVKPRQGTGMFVSEMVAYPPFQVTPGELDDLQEVLKLLELRLAVESEMASLAALRRTFDDLAAMRNCLAAIESSASADEQVKADVAFHAAIARASKNDYFQRFIDFLGARLVPPRSLLLQGQPAEAYEVYGRTLAGEHREVFEAIADQDPVRARTAARRHMQVSLERHAGLAQGNAER